MRVKRNPTCDCGEVLLSKARGRGPKGTSRWARRVSYRAPGLAEVHTEHYCVLAMRGTNKNPLVVKGKLPRNPDFRVKPPPFTIERIKPYEGA